MKRYEVALSDKIQYLEDTVSGYLMGGWVCQGGITIVRSVMGDQMYYQAMVKE